MAAATVIRCSQGYRAHCVTLPPPPHRQSIKNPKIISKTCVLATRQSRNCSKNQRIIVRFCSSRFTRSQPNLTPISRDFCAGFAALATAAIAPSTPSDPPFTGALDSLSSVNGSLPWLATSPLSVFHDVLRSKRFCHARQNTRTTAAGRVLSDIHAPRTCLQQGGLGWATGAKAIDLPLAIHSALNA